MDSSLERGRVSTEGLYRFGLCDPGVSEWAASLIPGGRSGLVRGCRVSAVGLWASEPKIS
jgi:hypothetical protein